MSGSLAAGTTGVQVSADSTVATFSAAVTRWIAENHHQLVEQSRQAEHSAEEVLAAGRRVQRMLHDSGAGRWGWPTEVGGLGGNTLFRAVMYDRLEAAGIAVPVQYEMLETLAPAVMKFAPEVAAELIPSALTGEHAWAQGFSEPEAGSDLAGLRCRARRDGEVYVVSGQKVWTSQGIGASRIGTLVRTGTMDSRHRGISMLMIDLDSPGVEVRPIRYANGENELAEVFFDNVRVPAERLVGAQDQGWGVAMFLLQYERGNYAWVRQAHIGRLVAGLAAECDETDNLQAHEVGTAWLAQQSLRIKCGRTVQRLCAGAQLGPEISVDKVLLGTAEQRVCDAAMNARPHEFALSADDQNRQWRADWFYTRASTLYGGSAEIQRSIIADRVLGLPKEG